MTVAKQDREENQRVALELMLKELGDRAIATCLFSGDKPPFTGPVLRTTWEELQREGYVTVVGSRSYRLTPKGWIVALQLADAANTSGFQERLGRLLAAMKKHIKGRKDSVIVPLRQLADESGEPEGWIFNVIDSKAGSTGNKRTTADWFENEKGQLVTVPVDFNLEPADVASALTVKHLERIHELEERIKALEEERAQFHCPHCDAPLAGVHHQDFIDYHCIVTYEEYACGYTTEDGDESCPCPYGPNWPSLDEFEFTTMQDGNTWICEPVPRTERAKRARVHRTFGLTKEEAEQNAKQAAAKKSKTESQAL